MARAHPTEDAPAATPHHTLEEASALLLSGLQLMRPRLAHGYGCPSETGGPCTCGYREVVDGTEELVDALTAAAPPATAG